MKRFLLAVAVAMMAACTHETSPSEDFLSDSDIRLEVGDRVLFRYKPLTCQMTWVPEQNIFRVHSDNMSDYFIVRLSDIPDHVGEEVNASLQWTVLGNSNQAKKKITLEAVKLEGDEIWLWNSRQDISLTLKLPED